MANQIIIDIGAAANDGTGDPLRTAFNYVNNNFSNVWNTGLPTSNVQFLDNKILTVNTNANLVLAPNGIGKVASNVDIVPNTANVFALGSPTRRWNTVYGQYLDLSHNATIGGNLIVTGNLSAGNISYTSNVFVGDLEGSVFDGASSIVLDVIDSAIYVDNYRYANGTPVSFGGTAGGSNTQVQFNNNGSFGGNTNFTFNSATGALQTAGNVFPHANLEHNLGAQLRYWNNLYVANISVIEVNASNNITATGNITGGNISAGNVFVTSTITSDECYIDNGTFTGDPNTGSGSLYVGSPTFTVLGTDIMAQFTGNVTNYGQINFQNYSNSVTASGDYIITADNGNDTTHFLDMGMTSSTWDGSETNVLAGLVANNGYLYVQDGNLTLGTRNGNTSYSWNFDTSGNLTVAGNVIPAGNNTQSLGSATRQWADLYVSNATIFMNNVPLSLNSSNVLTVNGQDVVTTNSEGIANIGNLQVNGTTVALVSGASQTLIEISPNGEGWGYLQIPNDATANVANVRMHNDAGNIEIAAGDTTHGGDVKYWYFDNTGNLTIPNGGYINFVNTGGITQAVNEDLRFTVSDDEADGWAIQSTVNDGAGNDLTRMQVRYDGVRINTDIPTNNYSFDFRESGEFDVPKSIRGPVGGNLVISIGDQFGAGPTFIDLQTISYVGDALISNIRIGDPNVTISTASGAQNWTFGSTGNLTLPENTGNINNALLISSASNEFTSLRGIDSGGNTRGRVTVTGTDSEAQTVTVGTYNANTDTQYDWAFDDGGSFTLSTGNVYFTSSANNPVIIPDSLGVIIDANRDDPGVDYISVTQDGVNLFSVNSINIENNTTGFTNSDINLRAGDDILLQGRNKPDDSEAEGGDINIYAGLGASAATSGFDTNGGGDIQIFAGDGGSDTGGGFGGSAGGFINISSGDGGAGSDTTNAGSGGSLGISAGSAAGVANTALGGIGGSISITAGDTTRINEIGGSISLNTGAASGDGTSPAGYVEINIPSSNVGPGGQWVFGGTGTTLNVPANAEIYGANFGNFTVGCAGNTIVTSSDYGANVQNWVFGYTGTLTFPGLANISGGNFNAGAASATVALNAFSPDGNTVSIQAQGNTSSAVISIFANAGPVTNNWVFTHATLDPTEPLFYVPGGAAIVTPEATGGAGGKNIFIEAGAADQQTYNTSAGGELFLKGGRGATNDGGGGGHGGNVNINAGESADPAGVAGNVYITAGALQNWVFDNTGNLTAPNNITTDGNITANIIGASTQLQCKYIVLDTISFTNLPSPTFGARAFINDANLVPAGNFGAQVSGGGGNTTPIWSDGTNWYIG